MRSEEMGEVAMNQVLGIIGGTVDKNSDIVLEPRLIVRQSARNPSRQ